MLPSELVRASKNKFVPRDTIKVKTTASLTLLNVSHCHSIVLSTNKVLLIIHANLGKPEIIHNVDTSPLLGGWPVKTAMTIIYG